MDFDPTQLADALRKPDEIDIGDLPNSQGGSFATGMINALKSGFTLPGDVATGKVDPMSDEGIARTQDMAGLAMTGGLAGAGEGAAVGSGPIRAYHGSPHDFDRFDLSKIGTGEGAQAYGEGLYFAENPEVARGYRDKLAAGPAHGSPEDLARNVMDAVGGDRDKALGELNSRLNTWLSQDPSLQTQGGYDRFMQAQQAIRSGKPLGEGRMYEVAIHADPARFLDWDKQLGGAPPPWINQALKPAQTDLKEIAATAFSDANPAKLTGQHIYNELDKYLGSPQAASEALREGGVPGMRYLDAGSRGADGGSGSRNLVVFSPEIIQVLRKYGVGSIAALPPAIQAMVLPNDHPREP